MLKLVELNYHCHTEYTSAEEVVKKHALSSGFIHFLKDRVNLLLVKHLNYEGEEIIQDIRYRFFKSRNRFWYIPFKTHRFIKKEKPDMVLVQGFVFVLQVILLRWALGKNVFIVTQHRGESPFNGIKGFLQRKADNCIDGYLFTSLNNATIWLDKRVISKKNKCYQIQAASSAFKKLDKATCKQQLKITGDSNFLWVGRLNDNKDPLTILKGFEKYLAHNAAAKFFMIYQTEELIKETEAMLSQSAILRRNVHLVGKVEHAELEYWYSAVDFYISGSHREASGFALTEAMSCGCIPIVSNIPSFRKITNDAQHGMLFEPGNAEDLYNKLLTLDTINRESMTAQIVEYSKTNLSYKAVADQIYELCLKFTAE